MIRVKKVQQLLALLIIMIQIVAVGCSSENLEGQIETAEDGTAKEKQGDFEGNMYTMENGKVTETWGVKLVDEPTTLKIFARQDSDAVVDEEAYFWTKMEEMTGVSVMGTANKRLDSVSDINIHAYEGLNSDIVSVAHDADEMMLLASEGMFYDLNDYLDYMPNLRAFIETDFGKQIYDMSLSKNGEFFLVPSVEKFKPTHMPMIRQDWLDKVGMEIPQTTDELYEVLTAFKENELGNGVTVPFVAKGWVLKQNAPVLWGARTETRATGRMVNNADGSFYHGWSTDEFRNMLTELSRWYDEGLLAENVFTVEDPLNDHLPTDQGGFTYWSLSKLGYNSKEDMPEGFNLVSMFPTEYNGQRLDQRATHSIRKGRIGISKSCESPEVAAMYLDALLSEEGTISQMFGFVNEQTKFVKINQEGYEIYQYTDEWSNTFNELRESGEYESDKEIQMDYGMIGIGLSLDAYSSIAVFGSRETAFEINVNSIENKYIEAYNNGTITFIPAKTMVFSQELTQEINEIKSKLEAYQDKVFEHAIEGDYELLDDAWWSNYISECNKLGMERLVEIYNY